MGKSNANECNESSLSNCRLQLALSTKKDGMILENLIYAPRFPEPYASMYCQQFDKFKNVANFFELAA